MKTAKLLKLAYAARVLGRDFLADPARRSHFVRIRHRVGGGLKAARHPFARGFGGALVGLVAFALVLAALAAVFALLGAVLKVALAVAAVVLAVRFLRRFGRKETRVVVVPPEARSAYYRS